MNTNGQGSAPRIRPSRTLGALAREVGQELRRRGMLSARAATSGPGTDDAALRAEWDALASDRAPGVSAELIEQLRRVWHDRATVYSFPNAQRETFLRRVEYDAEHRTVGLTLTQRMGRQAAWAERDRAWLREVRRTYRQPGLARLAWMIVEVNWLLLEAVVIVRRAPVFRLQADERGVLLEWPGYSEAISGAPTPLAMARRVLGIPAAILAQAAGIDSKATMSQYETGARELTVKVQGRLEQVLRLPEGSLDSLKRARQEAEAVMASQPFGMVRLCLPAGEQLLLSLSRACVQAAELIEEE